MFHRYIYLVIIVLLLTFSSQAYANLEPSNLLKLDKVTEEVLNNNKEIKLAQIQLERAKLELEKEKALALTNPSAEGLVNKELSLKAKQLELESLRLELSEEAESIYYDIWTAQENIKIYRESLEQAKENLRVIGLRSKAGLSTALEFLEAQNMADDALVKYQNELDSDANLKKKLAVLMSRNDLNGIRVDDSLEFQAAKISDTQINEGRIRDSEYTNALNEVELAKLKVKLLDTPYSSSIDKQISLKQLQEAELKLQLIKERVLTRIRELKVQILSNEREIKVSAKLKNYQSQRYNSLKARYQKGMELATKLIEAQIDLTKSKLDYTKNVLTMNLAKRKLANMILQD